MKKLLKCNICNREMYSLITHLKSKHQISGHEYKKIYGDCKLLSVGDEERKKISEHQKIRCQNPNVLKQMSEVQKNGASQFTTNYWIQRGYSEDGAKKRVSEIQKNNCEKLIRKYKNNRRELSWLCTEYWLKKGVSLNEAESIISKKQSELSSRSSRYTGCVRTDDQKERISKSVKRFIYKYGNGNWAKHFGNLNGRSKIEIEVFEYIKNYIDSGVEANVSIGNFIVDIIKNKKIIEFYGDFWHANPLIYESGDILKGYQLDIRKAEDIWNKDLKRTEYLNGIGYDVMVIWENEWINDKQKCIDRIKEYLT